MRLRDLPTRIATGGFILHSGLEHRKADEEGAARLHAMAAGAYPIVADVPAERFVKALAAAEIAIGVALVVPFVPSRLAGAALSGFGSALMGFYFRTPGLRKDGSVWPAPAGLGPAKDIWLVGAGLSLLLGSDDRSVTDVAPAEAGCGVE